MKKHQNKPLIKEEYPGVFVDVWYQELEHLAGQHVWIEDTVYKVIEDQEANTEFRLDNAELICNNVKLYKDENKALETIGEPGIGDTYISDNKLYSITTDDSEDFPDDGFLIVASVHERFYRAAIDCAESVKLFHPDAHITVFVDNEDWIKPSDYEKADWIVTWGVPNHIRAKLWALGRTPYKGKTCYLDADMLCQHEDIANVFDELPENLDLLFTKIRPYNAKITKLSNTEEMTMHCGMFVYRNNPQTIKLMNSWYGEYVKQQDPDHDIGTYPNECRKWDTFTMWKLLTYSDHGVFWDESLHIRWNFINGHLDSELEGEEIVMWHYSIPSHEIHLKK